MRKKKNKRDYDDYIFVRLPEGVKPRIAEMTDRIGLNMTAWVRMIVIENLETWEKKNDK